MTQVETSQATLAVPPADVDVVVDATRVIGHLIAESLAGLEPAITVPQWRVLVLVSQGACNVSTVAEDLRIHASNATRICDRLVNAGLVRRRRDTDDRRNVVLTLTGAGRRVYNKAMRARRIQVERAMARMSPPQRRAFIKGMAAFAEAVATERDGDALPR